MIKTKLNDKKTCKRCNEKIHDEDKFVLLGTYKENKVLDEVFFHFRCYLDWINEKITEHSTKQINESMSKTMGSFGPMIQKLQGFMEG